MSVLHRFRAVSPIIAAVIFGGLATLPVGAMADSRPDCDYLIVTTEDLAPAFVALADFRAAQGYATEVVTLEDVLATTDPLEDDAATLRSYLADRHAASGTQFVLLGGDAGRIPVRYCRFFSYPENYDYPADLYFACYEGDWNADGDDQYAEPEDAPDIDPAVALGRAPVSDLAEATAFVAKTMAFDVSTEEYRHQALLLGAVLMPYPWSPGEPVVYDGGLVCEEVRAQLAAYEQPFAATRYYQNHTAYEGALPLTGDAAMAALGSGQYGLTFVASHASHRAVDLGDRTVSAGEFAALANAPDFSVAIMLHGQLAGFHLEDCLLTSGLTNPDGGFVAGFGYTVLPYLAILRIYQDALFAAFAGTGDPRLGLAWRDCLHGQAEAASSGSVTHLRQHLALTLLGDPALALWPSGPTEVEDPDVPADQPLASAALAVEPCYPNPFNPQTTIAFTLARRQDVTLGVFDLRGRMVRQLVAGESRDAGRHTVIWDGVDQAGRSVPSGTYMFRVQCGEAVRVGRMMLTK